MQAFDSANTKLSKGVTLLEASAGTGKTYALARIFLRLVAEEGVEGRAADLAAVDHVEEALVLLDVSKPLVPFRLFDAGQLLALDLGDQRLGGVRERLGRVDLLIGLAHRLRD